MSEDFLISEIGPEAAASERADINRLKYQVFVEEQGRSGSGADHERRVLEEADDPESHLIQARLNGGLVGALRLTWGGDGDFTEGRMEDYGLAPFLAIVAPDQVVLLERLVTERSQRDGNLLNRLLSACMSFANQRRIQLVFATSEPPQVRHYLDLGFRTYTRRIINNPESGYLVPLVLVVEDIAHLRAIDSPLAAASTDYSEDARLTPDLGELLGQLLESDEAISSRRLFSKEEFWTRVKRSAVPAKIKEVGLFDGLSESEIRACLRNSTSFECQAGHRIIKRGESATNMCMALTGTLEVRDGDEVVAIVSAGEVFGEIAFFLGLPRTMDVVAATDGVKVVSFSEATIRNLIHHEAETATKLLLNISKMLCARVVKLD